MHILQTYECTWWCDGVAVWWCGGVVLLSAFSIRVDFIKLNRKCNKKRRCSLLSHANQIKCFIFLFFSAASLRSFRTFRYRYNSKKSNNNLTGHFFYWYQLHCWCEWMRLLESKNGWFFFLLLLLFCCRLSFFFHWIGHPLYRVHRFKSYVHNLCIAAVVKID